MRLMRGPFNTGEKTENLSPQRRGFFVAEFVRILTTRQKSYDFCYVRWALFCRSEILNGAACPLVCGSDNSFRSPSLRGDLAIRGCQATRDDRQGLHDLKIVLTDGTSAA